MSDGSNNSPSPAHDWGLTVICSSLPLLCLKGPDRHNCTICKYFFQENVNVFDLWNIFIPKVLKDLETPSFCKCFGLVMSVTVMIEYELFKFVYLIVNTVNLSKTNSVKWLCWLVGEIWVLGEKMSREHIQYWLTQTRQ